MSRVAHFEIHADQPERAIAFYSKLFAWTFNKWDGPQDYWLIQTGEQASGINGGLMQRMGPPPSEGQAVNAYPCTVDVANLDETTAKVTQLGGSIVVPKMEIPKVGWLAYAKDTEGNIFGMMQSMI